MKRKIAIIADGWRRHITYVWIRGCRKYIKEHELDIEISVFHSFGNFSRDEKFNAGEYNIIHLPDLSQFDGIILGPRLLGQSTGLSQIWVIFAITVGGAYFGVIGMFIGVPVVAVIAYLCNTFLNSRLKGKHVKALKEFDEEP